MKKKLLTIVLTFVSMFAFINLYAQESKVVVYRKGCIYGSLAKYKVNVDGKEMSSIRNNSTYSFNLAPGSHTISPKNKKHAITFNTEAGKSYAVKYRTVFGLFGARPRLKEMTLDAAKKDDKKVMKMYM